MIQIWDLVLARQKALLASVDAIPELRGAGVVVMANGRQLVLRPSHHPSRRDTYVVVSYAERPPEALGGALLESMLKLVVDHAFSVGGGSTYDAAVAMGDRMIAEPVRATVRREDFATKILPKLVGVGIAGLGLVVAIPAVCAAAGVGTMLLALGGAGAAAAGFSAAVGMLYYQLVDPKLTALMDEDPGFARFQAQLEVFGLATGVTSTTVELARANLLKCLRAHRVLTGYKRMELDTIVSRVQRLNDEQFAELCRALRGARMRQTGSHGADLQRLRAGGADLPIAGKLPAYHVQEQWVARCRRDFYRALFADAKTVGRHFVGDGGNALGLASSAMPSSIVGGASGLMNKPFEAAIQATADALMGLTYFVAQTADGAARAPHAPPRYEKAGA